MLDFIKENSSFIIIIIFFLFSIFMCIVSIFLKYESFDIFTDKLADLFKKKNKRKK